MSRFALFSATEFTADDDCVYRASAVLKYVDRTDAHFVEVRVDTTSFVLTDRHHRVPLELLDDYLGVIRATVAACRFRLNKDPSEMPDFESTLRSVIGESE